MGRNGEDSFEVLIPVKRQQRALVALQESLAQIEVLFAAFLQEITVLGCEGELKHVQTFAHWLSHSMPADYHCK